MPDETVGEAIGLAHPYDRHLCGGRSPRRSGICAVATPHTVPAFVGWAFHAHAVFRADANPAIKQPMRASYFIRSPAVNFALLPPL